MAHSSRRHSDAMTFSKKGARLGLAAYGLIAILVVICPLM